MGILSFIRSDRPLNRHAGAHRHWMNGRRPALELLEDRIVPSDFTTTSPTSRGCCLPASPPSAASFSTSSAPTTAASSARCPPAPCSAACSTEASRPEFNGNPGTIGEQSGFSDAVIDALGGGLSEVAVRTDTVRRRHRCWRFRRRRQRPAAQRPGTGRLQRSLSTQVTDETGNARLLRLFGTGFRNETLHTGFFYSNDPDFLMSSSTPWCRTGQVTLSAPRRRPVRQLLRLHAWSRRGSRGHWAAACCCPAAAADHRNQRRTRQGRRAGDDDGERHRS